jgi:co-chaperonin GroES (HSP10)
VIKPILHRILVKPDDIEDKDEAYKKAKAAGLFVHRDERDREQAAIDSGTVISFGETVFRDFGVESNPIKVGDKVVYARYAGKVIEDPADQVKYVALNDEDVIAIITTEGA